MVDAFLLLPNHHPNHTTTNTENNPESTNQQQGDTLTAHHKKQDDHRVLNIFHRSSAQLRPTLATVARTGRSTQTQHHRLLEDDTSDKTTRNITIFDCFEDDTSDRNNSKYSQPGMT